MKIILIAGARPNFMKIAPLMRAMRDTKIIDPLLVHTGQHYDKRMSGIFFDDLSIPRPDVNLEIGSASAAVQTAEIMKAFEPIVAREKPRAVLVVGDVNSTIACGMTAVKMGVELIHVEAGLRSFDRTMPEEINRILTDTISNYLFCTEQSAVENLQCDASDGEIFFVGNVMIDTLLSFRERAEESAILDKIGLASGGYSLVTLHRPANVDCPAAMGRILDAMEVIQRENPVVFPLHPRTKKNIDAMGLGPRIDGMKGLKIIEPLGYLDFLKLMSSAAVVLTDSGGMQEETCILRVPCLTLRENTERPSTVAAGGNKIVGTKTGDILSAFTQATGEENIQWKTPPLWDGHAAERIVEIIEKM